MAITFLSIAPIILIYGRSAAPFWIALFYAVASVICLLLAFVIFFAPKNSANSRKGLFIAAMKQAKTNDPQSIHECPDLDAQAIRFGYPNWQQAWHGMVMQQGFV